MLGEGDPWGELRRSLDNLGDPWGTEGILGEPKGSLASLIGAKKSQRS